MTTQSTAQAEQISIAGKNAIIENIHAKMGICPFYVTNQILDEVLVQKKSWGGKDVPENKVRMSAPANVEYMLYAQSVGVLDDQSESYYREIYDAFIDPARERPKVEAATQVIQIIKALVAIREATLNERMAMVRRIADRAVVLDLLYPIEKAERIKSLEKFRKENEPLLKEIQNEQNFSWQNLLGFGTAQMGYVQKTLIEKELEAIVSKFPIWEYFGKHIPGFGVWTCAYFIAKLQDPTRFPDSGKVRAFCGVAPKGGQTMRPRRGEKLNYDPGMKEILCKIFPESFRKIAAKFPDEPYAHLLQECIAKQKAKAENATDAYIKKYFSNRGEVVVDIQRLGHEDRDGKMVFLGYKVKTDKSLKAVTSTNETEGFVKPEDEVDKGGYKHFLNPGHVQQMAFRQFSTMFISDFYHAWLFLVGENPRVEGNLRIMAVFAKANI